MLYIVPTPIGNLKDITLRALDVLKDVDLILAEDTRQTRKLIEHYQISKPIQSHHKFNEHSTLGTVIQQLKGNNKIALVSDGGTPGISDPGFLLVRECIKENIKIECLPGPTALIPALVQSGFPCNSFIFEGFLPVKKGRQTKLKELALEKRTMIFYESPHRVLKTLNQFKDFFGGERHVSISREMTKIYDETIRGSLNEIIEFSEKKIWKGEVVIVVNALDITFTSRVKVL